MGVYNTRKILEELEEILKANPEIDLVSQGKVTPLASETSPAAVYISLEEIALTPAKMSTGVSGYERHMLIHLYCNYDTQGDPLAVCDFADSIEKCILDDKQVWSYVTDRDLVAIDFDNQANSPKRSFTMLFDFYYSVKC